jgi:ribose transport system permease protein
MEPAGTTCWKPCSPKTTRDESMKSRSYIADLVERFGLLGLLVVMVVFFSVSPKTPQFSSSINITNILSNESLLGILVVATVIPLIAGEIDLSIGPSAGLGSILCAGLMSKSGWPLGMAIVAAVVMGLLIGCVNGVLVARFKINSIIATLGTSSIIAAVVLAYSGGLSIVTGISPHLTDIGHGKWVGLPKPFYFFLGVALVVWYLLEQTPRGKDLRAVGSSPAAAQLVGIRVPRQTMQAFVVAGGIAGAAGVLLVAVQGAGNPQIGANYTLPAIASAFLGATAVQPGRYNVWGSVTAVFFLAVAINGLTLWGAPPWTNDLFNGVALIVGVGLAVYAGKVRQRVVPAAPSTPAGDEPTDQSPPVIKDTIPTTALDGSGLSKT